MWTLVALFFLLVNGVPADEPLAAVSKHTTFASKEECMNYLDTDQGAADRARIIAMATEHHHAVKFACTNGQPDKDKQSSI